jgi:peptidoglycan biosynthesis protein MviN/MurJ (putative lipid II flippase)
MAFTLGIGLKMIGVHYDGVRGLALGSSAYYLLSVIAMSFALSRRCDSIRWRVEVIPTVFRVLIATILGGVGAYGVLATSIAHIWWLAVMVGAGIYGISLWLLGEPTWSALLSGKERAKKGDSV